MPEERARELLGLLDGLEKLERVDTLVELLG